MSKFFNPPTPTLRDAWNRNGKNEAAWQAFQSQTIAALLEHLKTPGFLAKKNVCEIILDFMGEKRAAIARALCHKPVESFGARREIGVTMFSPVSLGAPYAGKGALLASLQRRIQSAIENHREKLAIGGTTKKANRIHLAESEKQVIREMKLVGQEFNECTRRKEEVLSADIQYQRGRIEFKNIPLSYLVHVGDATVREFFIIHTDPADFPDLYRQINQWIHELPDLPDQQTKLEQIARIVWLLSQATFFDRGSASITQLICRAFLFYCNIDLGPEKTETPLDLIALTTPDIEVFVREFSSYFDPAPVPSIAGPSQ